MVASIQQASPPTSNFLRMSASLPMYNLPEMKNFNSAFWQAMSEELRALGRTDFPLDLSFTRPAVPDQIGPEVYFSQTCGYPLQTIYGGQYHLLGVPTYGVPGCGPSSHCAFVVVNKDSVFLDIDDLRGRAFAVNSRHSNSGMNLPRRLISKRAGGKPFFSRVVETGTHPASMELVSSGEVDGASIDCVTLAFFSEYRPEATARLRILAETPASPAIPFVTSITTPDEDVEVLRRVLLTIGTLDKYRAIRQPLKMLSIAPAKCEDYKVLLAYELEAAALGYPKLE